MKKIACSILAFVLMVSSCVIGVAEDFSVHGGIKFGMTQKQILEIEPDSKKGGKYVDDVDKYNFFGYSHCPNLVGSFKGNVWYWMDNNLLSLFDPSLKKLERIEIGFGQIDNTLEKIPFITESLYLSLTKNYGEPTFSSKMGKYSIYCNEATEQYVKNLSHGASYYQWVRIYDDVGVVITLYIDETFVDIYYDAFDKSKMKTQEQTYPELLDDI